jgi:hypothetical protein
MAEAHTTDDSAAGDEGELSPEQAAQLIEQTSQEARRQFGYWQSPWYTLAAAAIWLAIYGTLWLSVRGQHPYKGPTGWALLTIFSLIAVAAIAGSIVTKPRRARQGVSGRSRRREAYLGAVMGSAYVGAVVFQGALRYLDVSWAIVYGVYPAVVSPIVLVAAGGVFAAVPPFVPAHPASAPASAANARAGGQRPISEDYARQSAACQVFAEPRSFPRARPELRPTVANQVALQNACHGFDVHR